MSASSPTLPFPTCRPSFHSSSRTGPDMCRLHCKTSLYTRNTMGLYSLMAPYCCGEEGGCLIGAIESKELHLLSRISDLVFDMTERLNRIDPAEDMSHAIACLRLLNTQRRELNGVLLELEESTHDLLTPVLSARQMIQCVKDFQTLFTAYENHIVTPSRESLQSLHTNWLTACVHAVTSPFLSTVRTILEKAGVSPPSSPTTTISP